jgi:TRAP-type C4-dicarboxylate transport system permease small subunit
MRFLRRAVPIRHGLRCGEERRSTGRWGDLVSHPESTLCAWARKALDSIPKLGLIVGAFGISLMVIMIIAEIISTKLFDFSLPYVIEYSEYLVPIIVFWGATYTLSREGHVRADIFVHRLPDRTREWVILVGYVLGLVFLIIVSKHMFNVAWLSLKMNRLSFYPTVSPLGPPQMAAALGLGLFTLQLLIEIVKKARQLYLHYRSNSPPRS